MEVHFKPEIEARLVSCARLQGRKADELLQTLLEIYFAELPLSDRPASSSGTALIAAMQASPYKELNIEPTRDRLPVRETSL